MLRCGDRSQIIDYFIRLNFVSIQILLLSFQLSYYKLCCVHLYLDSTTRVPLPPLPFTPNLITVILYYTLSKAIQVQFALWAFY